VNADEIVAIAQVAAAVATGTLALLTYRYVKATRAMVDEMRAAREAASEPFVIADVELRTQPGWAVGDLWIVVENAGRAPAFDVIVTADQVIEWHHGSTGDRLFDLEFLPAGVRRSRFASPLLGLEISYPPVRVTCSWSSAPGGHKRTARSVLEPGPQVAAYFHSQAGYTRPQVTSPEADAG
jgi:hypothetical protein